MTHAANIIRPRIHVVCLAAYNSGYPHGAWIDANQDADAIRAGIAAMIARSPVADAEGYAIHADEGFGILNTIGEYEDIETVARKAAFIVEHGPKGAAVLAHVRGNIVEAERLVRDRYIGRYGRLADYMEDRIGETIPEALRFYIDWEAMARDAESNGDVLAIEALHGEVYVFSGR